MHGKLNLNLVYALSTRSLWLRLSLFLCHIAILLEYLRELFQCILYFSDVCESTKIVSAKRLRCMRIDQDRVGKTTSMYANRPVCESTCMRNDRHPFLLSVICNRGFCQQREGTFNSPRGFCLILLPSPDSCPCPFLYFSL